MTYHPDLTAEITVVIVDACWLGFFAILFVGRRSSSRAEVRRDMTSHLGFFLQSLAYVICVMFHRKFFSTLFPMSKTSETMLAIITVTIALSSVWFCFESARSLGKQWSLVARVVEDHQLITGGPYALVRNPIYLAMLGMLLATGITFSYWPALVGAIPIFVGGTHIRIRREERLLTDAFGSQFADYSRDVPALFPRIW